ncbi:MAG: DNA-binding response regulator [Acidobacteria bacterium]|nr:MAG: DNA-binding response regulator [Acidobacteriota bacterium]PYS16730.1 MAG: DNA-binding response regulator [Acidobacteriota bacterium]
MNSARILVVDDDPQIRRVLRTALIAQGYEVTDARNGEEALEKMRDEKPDLLILDMNMPRMNGLETCHSIRTTSDVPIIMLTVRDAESDKVDALDAGADDYMTKPFSSPELLARIRAALRRSPQLAGEMQVVRFDDVEINFNLRRVVVGNREARLTPKEFDLLQYFVAHPNVPVSHTKLLQSVWGPDYGDEVEYLRVFVNQLRKKIEKNPSDPKYLITEPWVGYRFHLPG